MAGLALLQMLLYGRTLLNVWWTRSVILLLFYELTRMREVQRHRSLPNYVISNVIYFVYFTAKTEEMPDFSIERAYV